MGSPTGALRSAATKRGLTLGEYLQITAESKWCTLCGAWHPHANFGRDKTRGDGKATHCLKSARLTPTQDNGKERQ